MCPHSVLNMADARQVECVEPDMSGYGHRHFTPGLINQAARVRRRREQSAAPGSAESVTAAQAWDCHFHIFGPYGNLSLGTVLGRNVIFQRFLVPDQCSGPEGV